MPVRIRSRPPLHAGFKDLARRAHGSAQHSEGCRWPVATSPDGSAPAPTAAATRDTPPHARTAPAATLR